jgi:hemolysin activation/secretion protein
MIPWTGRICAAAALLWLALLPALAQVIPPGALPGREREQFETPPRPRSQLGGANITLPSTVAPPGAENVTVLIRDVKVVGSTIYRADELAPYYNDIVGQRVRLTAVYDIAQRITARYGNDGYVLSRAIVPPQNLDPQGAHVRIEIVEGYIDAVVWPPTLSQYVNFFSYYTDRIIADRPSNVRTMERYLLLAADLPGLKFKNSLKTSTTRQGAATLVVEVEPKPIDLLARFDNRGNQARGPMEYLGSATFNNLLHMHEGFNVTYAGTTQTEELHYLAAAYRQVLTPEGLSVFADASLSKGKPGIPTFSVLDYKTVSNFAEAGLTYPVIRQRERNLSVTALWFMTHDEGNILAAPNSLDRLRGVRVRVESDFADPFQGINQLNVVTSHGIEGLGSTLNGNPFASRANGTVDFTKLEVTASRLQQLPSDFSFLGALYGQYAFQPLLASELCGYGGRYFGRAYDPSDLVADNCIEVLGELRYDVPWLKPFTQQAQLYAFADGGWLHNLAPVSGTPRDQDGASVGGGVRLGWWQYYSVDVSGAKAIAGPRDNWRAFFILTGRY